MRILMILLPAVAVVLTLAACQAADAGSGSNVAGAEKPDRVVRSPGKPLHPIQVKAVVDGPVKAGVESAATLVVTSSRRAESMEVIVQPQLATVISQNRFERHNGDLVRGKPVELGFRFRPVNDEPQPVEVLVRVTGADGSVLTREVTLSLGGSGRDKARQGVDKAHDAVTGEAPEPADEVVVPAEQEIRRKKNSDQ